MSALCEFEFKLHSDIRGEATAPACMHVATSTPSVEEANSTQRSWKNDITLMHWSRGEKDCGKHWITTPIVDKPPLYFTDKSFPLIRSDLHQDIQ